MWPGKALGFTLFLMRSSVRSVICAPGGTSAGFGPHGILSEARLQGPSPSAEPPPSLGWLPACAGGCGFIILSVLRDGVSLAVNKGF